MSDKEFGGMSHIQATTNSPPPQLTSAPGNEDLSLPKATVQKIINEVLATNPSLKDGNGTMSFAKDTRDLLIDASVEFINLISSEANEIAEKEAKKTIGADHIFKALEELGFGDYNEELGKVADGFKAESARREKKQTKIENSGLSAEELQKMQDDLFKKAGEKYTGESQD